MSREVCGICWCPYDEETGECACKPTQPTPEPVAWGVFEGENLHDFYTLREDAEKMAGYKGSHATVMPLYTAPPQRKPLTEEDLRKLADKHLFHQPESYEASGVFALARAIERWLKGEQ